MLESLPLDPKFFLGSELAIFSYFPNSVMAGGQELRRCWLLGPLKVPVACKSFVVDFFHPRNFWTGSFVEETGEISCASRL